MGLTLDYFNKEYCRGLNKATAAVAAGKSGEKKT